MTNEHGALNEVQSRDWKIKLGPHEVGSERMGGVVALIW